MNSISVFRHFFSVVWVSNSVVLLGCVLQLGCGSPLKQVTGGDRPVTPTRLVDHQATDIREPVTWTFSINRVVIEHENRSLPEDILKLFSIEGDTPQKLNASWRLDERVGVLVLTNIQADGVAVEKDVSVSIKPAGPLRVNIDARQYNLLEFEGLVGR
ncbi:MAG: hypothetical protein VXX55_08705 [Planctomycetota bacterium]|nr:hypothetical protein [Planctomycetota bacterium]